MDIENTRQLAVVVFRPKMDLIPYSNQLSRYFPTTLVHPTDEHKKSAMIRYESAQIARAEAARKDSASRGGLDLCFSR
jgi:hypothetical protein